MDLGLLLSLGILELHFHNDSWKVIVIVIVIFVRKRDIFISHPEKSFSQRPGFPIIGGAFISDIDFDSGVFKLFYFLNDISFIDKEHLVGFELILVLDYEKEIVLFFINVNVGSYLLIKIHVLNLNYQHKSVYTGFLFA